MRQIFALAAESSFVQEILRKPSEQEVRFVVEPLPDDQIKKMLHFFPRSGARFRAKAKRSGVLVPRLKAITVQPAAHR